MTGYYHSPPVEFHVSLLRRIYWGAAMALAAFSFITCLWRDIEIKSSISHDKQNSEESSSERRPLLGNEAMSNENT